MKNLHLYGMALLVLVGLFFLPLKSRAGDAGITLQTTLSSSYGKTLALSAQVVAMLSIAEDSDNREEIAEVLKQLNDGDILVMSIHSNPSVFAIGNEAMHWAFFWEYFGIENPPKLAVVIIGGCMARSFEYQGKKIYIPITEPEMNFIHKKLGAKALFLPRAAIQPHLAVQHISGFLKHMIKEGKRLAIYNPGKLWHYITQPGVNRIAVTLEDLRKLARAGSSEEYPAPGREAGVGDPAGRKPARKALPSEYKSLEWNLDR